MQPSQSYDMTPRAHTPLGGSYDSYAPRAAPGTPGTFASDVGGKRNSDVPSTYYFNKEGGPAALAANDAGALAPVKARGGPLGFVRRRPVLTGLLVLLLVAIGVGAGVGASMAMKSSSSPANASAANEGSKTSNTGTTHSGGSTATTSGSDSGNSTTSSTNTTAAAPAFTPFEQWSFTDTSKKMFGVSLGNWLVLERWMNEDWMIQQGGDNAVDEWTLTQILGDKAKDVLSAHWDSWVSEAELDKLQSVGVNYIRIPVGYWAFIPAAKGEPYLAMAGQKEQMDKLLGWMSTRGMYAMIDLHGMPGSQNGDQSCGHTTSTIGWFSDYNQGLSDQTIDAVIAWINQNEYKSLISSVGVVNEPRPNGNSGRLATLTSFYERSYQKLKANNLTMFFHHGFITDGSPLDYWRDFATGKDPNYLVYEDHPYPGYFPLNTDQDNMISRVCQLAQNAVGFPVPMSMTEWSAVNGGGTLAFTKEYYNTQVSAWAWSAGSVFWSFKLMHSSTKVLAVADYLQDQYSMLTMIDQGVITAPASGQSAFDGIKALPNQKCGDIPTPKWSNPSRQGAGYQGRRRDADGLVRRTRSKRAL